MLEHTEHHLGGDTGENRDAGAASTSSDTAAANSSGGSATGSGGDVSVRNEATLTIEPGTKIIVGLDAGIDFGWENSHPKLLAEGTPEAPILFCGETDTPGYWDSLSFEPSVDPASVLRNVLIQEAGAESAALVVDGPVSLQGVQVVDSCNDGVEASVFGAGSTVLSIHNSGRYAGWFCNKHEQLAVSEPRDDQRRLCHAHRLESSSTSSVTLRYY